MLCGLAAVHQASVLDGLSFDPFSFQQDGLAAPEVDVSRGEIGDGLVVSQVIVVGDEGGDLGVEIAGQIVVLQKDSVLERLMPALDLALCHGVIGGATDSASSGRAGSSGPRIAMPPAAGPAGSGPDTRSFWRMPAPAPSMSWSRRRSIVSPATRRTSLLSTSVSLSPASRW